MVPSLRCTFVAHIIFLHVFFLSPFLSLSLPLSLSRFLSLSLSIYVSLWLQVTCHMMPFTKQHSACAWVVTCILFLINLTFHNLSLHSSYTIHQPFTDYFLRLPYSELLEKRIFRSRANRRLVFWGSIRGSAFLLTYHWVHPEYDRLVGYFCKMSSWHLLFMPNSGCQNQDGILGLQWKCCGSSTSVNVHGEAMFETCHSSFLEDPWRLWIEYWFLS